MKERRLGLYFIIRFVFDMNIKLRTLIGQRFLYCEFFCIYQELELNT